MVRKTKAEALETRHQILDAAEQVFLRQGVARTSLQQIAEAAGLTRGAVYWHFENKSALFQAMMDRLLMPCETALADMQALPPADALQRLADLALAPLQDLATRPEVQRVFTIAMHLTEYSGEMAGHQQRHADCVQMYLRQLEAVLARVLPPADSAAASPGISPREAAMGLFSLVDGLMYHWTLAPDSFDLVAVGRHSITAFLRGLAHG